MIYITENEN